MSGRWQHKVVEIPFKLFGGKTVANTQSELDKHGALGWELVAVLQATPTDNVKLFFKKEV